MSLKAKVLASYAGQIYVTLIGILMVPMYVRYMGVEAYGLVGFFAMLQAWFQLMDMGMTPTMARETARFTGSPGQALQLRRLVRALETIFVTVAVVGAAGLMAGADWIAGSWLKVQTLPLDEVRLAIMLMAVCIALRWMSGLYRGAVTGFERQIWLSGFNIVVASCRFILVIPVFVFVGSSPVDFFLYQAVVAFLELLALTAKTYQLLPRVGANDVVNNRWSAVRNTLKFSLSIAFTSSVWIVVTQADKLILSKLLPLSEYAYFTLAVLVAGGVGIVSGPISGAIMPRLTRLAGANSEVELFRLYRNATQLIAAIAVPVALVLGLFSREILLAWTGDAAIATRAAPILSLYALGNGVLAIGAFPYYLQFAKGDLRLHMMGNLFFIALLIPALIWSTLQFGVKGAGYAWLGTNLAYLLIWVPRVHRHFAPGLHSAWLLRDVATIVGPPLFLAFMVRMFLPWPADRLMMALTCVCIGVTLVLMTVAASSYFRQLIHRTWLTRFGT